MNFLYGCMRKVIVNSGLRQIKCIFIIQKSLFKIYNFYDRSEAESVSINHEVFIALFKKIKSYSKQRFTANQMCFYYTEVFI